MKNESGDQRETLTCKDSTMNEITNGYQDGLKILDDVKETKKEMGGVASDVREAGSGMNGIVGLAGGGEKGKGVTGLANKAYAADSSSESSKRASDDTYSIGSFFSDLQSFGSDAAELLEESKKFFTKLGAVVAIIGTCITSAKTLVDAIRDEHVKTAVLTGILLIGIQIPTTLAMLFVFLKEWVKASITGFFKAKKQLEELASDLDSFIDDSEADGTVKELAVTTASAKEKLEVETDELRNDLEKTKRKNNYSSVEGLQKYDSVGFSSALERKPPAKQTPDGGIFLVNDASRRKGDPDTSLDRRIRQMEEGDIVSERTDNCSTVSRTTPKRQLPRTPSSNRDTPVPGESHRMSSKAVQTSSMPDRKNSRPSHSSGKPAENRNRSSSKSHSEKPSKGRSEPHRSSSRVSRSNAQRRKSGTSRRTSEVPSTKRTDSRREKTGDVSTKPERSHRDKRTASGRRSSDVHHSRGTNNRNSRRVKSEQAANVQNKRPTSATQTVQEAGSTEPKPDVRENGRADGREDNNGEPLTDKKIRPKCWSWLWKRGERGSNGAV